MATAKHRRQRKKWQGLRKRGIFDSKAVWITCLYFRFLTFFSMVFRFQINRLLFSSIVSFPVQSCSFRTIFCYLYHILIIFYRVMFAFSSHFHQIFINFSNFYCLLHVRVPAITRLDTSCPTEKPFKTLRKLDNLHVSLIKRPADGIAHRQGTAQLQQ